MEAGAAGDKQPSSGGGLMGTAAHMAQGWMAGGEGGAKEGGAGGGAAGVLTAAQGWLGSGEGGAEGGHKADPGLVDKLLRLFEQTQGKPVSERCRGAASRARANVGAPPTHSDSPHCHRPAV